MNHPLFSIIIPVRIKTKYLSETLRHLTLQSFKSFEVLVITDKISKNANPAKKRNLGAKMSKGKYLAFLDDDSYPDNDWLKNAKTHLESDSNIAAVCGPCLTPPEDNIYQQASGLVWSSFFGSGGAGSYRNNISSSRYVDDFPSVNLIIKKQAFNQVDGFSTDHWPGEDTLLCLKIVYKLKLKIFYHPSIVVFHHRRQVFIPHLQQITRYAIHRGNFSHYYPQNSLKLGYLIPSIFSLYILSLPVFLLFKSNTIYFFPLFLYLSLVGFTFIHFIYQKKSFYTSILATLCIPATHLYYGILFIYGFFTKKIIFKPHHIDRQTNSYLGG